MEEEEVLSKKQRNTFKFQGFNEHKERIKLALLRNQLFPIKLDSDTDTKCAAALEKWTELNSTTEYVAFRRDVEVFVQSLEILVLHKDDVIATFKEALQNSSIESLQPIMEFGVALCFDLSEAMQWEFGSLVSIYTGLLSRHSAASSHQALEHVFTGISYTLYALRRQLRRQPDEAAIQLKPLLLAGGHVTELAAESFAFLLRKLPNQSNQLTARLLDLLASWLDSAAASDDADLMTEAVSGTVFYWLRGAAGQLAAGPFQTVYPRLIDWLIVNQELPATREIRLRCLTLVHVRLLRHARRGDNSDAAIEPIRRQLLDRLAGGSASDAAELVARLLLGEFDDCYSKKNRRQALVLSQALIGGKSDPERWCRCVEKLSNNQSTWSKSVARLTAGLTRYFCQSSDGTSKITVDHCLEDNFCQRLFRCCRLSTWTLPDVDADNSEIWRRRFEFVQLVGGAGVGDEAGSDSGSLGRRFLRLALPMLAEAVCLGGAEAFEQLGAFCLAPASGCWRAPAESFEAVPAEDRLIDWAECGSEEKVLTELSSTIDRLASSADGFLCNRLALCCSFLPMSKFASESSLASVLDKLVNLTVRQLSNSSQTVALTLDQCQALFRCIYALLNLSADAVQLQNLISSLIDSLPCNCASPIYWKCIDFLLQFLSDRGDHLKLIFDNSNLANKLNSLAIDCLTSASHCVRLHCLRTLRQIVKQDANNPDDSVLLLLRCIESCLAAESLTVGIENLRECLRLLDGLDAERMAAASAAPSVAVSTLCCRYLLGLLRTQFTPLWTPIAKLLASHAAYAGSAFWSVLTSALTTANIDSASIIKDNAVETDDNGNDKQQKEEVAMETDSGDTVFINSFLDNETKRLSYGQSSPSLERIDPLTYRLQLWRCLRVLSPQLVAKRTAVTSPLILACLRNGEFCPSPNREPWIIRRRCQATLVAMLDLYSGLGKAIKCVSGEAELHRWYYSLLQCSAAQVRKAALRCIIAYGDKTLAGKPAAASSVDWIGFLHRLSDFKSTKEALVSIGGDLSEASELQRQAVLAVAMRLLLGRVRSGGGAGGQLQCIFAFLEESCQPEERRSFLNQLLFDQFAGLSLDNVSSIEIDSDVSIGRLQAAAKCALLVLSSMRLDASELCKLYSLLLCFCALLPRLAASLAANNTTSVSRIASSQLRGLRQACQKAVLRALESGSDRLLTERLIDDTFKHCVEPHLPRLATEAATAGTPGLALRLLQIWSADNRHDRLLEGQPIQSLAELLGNANSPSNGSVSEPVLLACLSIFNNLLGEEADSTAPIEAMQADNRKLSRPHYLMPVADSLASFVSNRLSPGRLEASIDVSREALRLLALLVDNGLYRAEACEKLAGTLLRLLLLPMDGKKSKSSKKKVGGGIGGLRSDEFQARLLAALLTLLKRAASPCRTLFLQAFTLFSKLTHRSSRILLCQIAEAAVSKLGLVSQPLGELANDLNAWDKRHIEMPDFERRERGHQSALTIVTALTAGPSLSSSSLSGWSQLLNNRLETLLIAEHCALHTLAHVTDGPLRLLASELLQSLIAALAGLDIASTNAADRDESEARSRVLNMLLWRSVWPAIAQGVKMDENRRVEYIGLLGKIVTEFGRHARLQGLAGLLPSAQQQQQQQQQASADASAGSSTSASVNDSFFDNVRSVNSARIVKGFRQLITYLASPRGDCIPANLLYHYLLPLPMHYLHKSGRSASAGKQQQQQQASNRRSLIESSLELLASISSRLSWPMLQQLLKLCLKGLDGPATESKLPVRLAVAALSGLGEIGEVDEDDQLEIEPEAASKQSGNRKRRLRFFQQSVPVSNIFATVKRAKKLSPEVNNGRPEVTNSKSEVTNGKPEVTKGEPEVTIGEPEVTKGEPEMTNRKLEVTKGEPEVTNGEPEVTNEEPEASNSATRSMGGSGPLTFLIEFVCPRLERHLSRDKTAAEQQHRLAPRQEPQVLQVSVAVALAQLLAKLPRRLRDQRLPKLVYRLAEFLRSREHAVRKEAGATLVRVVQLLGNDYLGFVARELSLLLARGYTRHVLAHTLHSLLRHCQAAGMPTGCLDGETLDRLCRIYMDELLGDLSKEKEVEALTRKLPEAQRTHAYSVMHRLGSMVAQPAWPSSPTFWPISAPLCAA
ncbi:hypothetical protein BOX15_Mlig015680g2 [Macrostomum lignano]|uniref:Uncharacterized protein n=2 Tax=Macrostomum lignano TaxID=282301 RepID=A0A267EAY2_9PLAT|nr:hypothetical protein BOX15_Mlig015680g2 [Macrostomum lignano]